MTYAECSVIKALVRRDMNINGIRGGVRLTKELIDKHLPAAKQIRDAWVAEHGDDKFLPLAMVFAA